MRKPTLEFSAAPDTLPSCLISYFSKLFKKLQHISWVKKKMRGAEGVVRNLPNNISSCTLFIKNAGFLIIPQLRSQRLCLKVLINMGAHWEIVSHIDSFSVFTILYTLTFLPPPPPLDFIF